RSTSTPAAPSTTRHEPAPAEASPSRRPMGGARGGARDRFRGRHRTRPGARRQLCAVGDGDLGAHARTRNSERRDRDGDRDDGTVVPQWAREEKVDLLRFTTMADTRDTAARTPVPADEPDWLTLGQAAKYLGMAQSTIRKWSDTGRLPAFYTPGGHRRYRRADLDQFLERGGAAA